ncbi:MAG: hypothetical protein V3S01_00870 [Dehalococcoidia bacterium]
MKLTTTQRNALTILAAGGYLGHGAVVAADGTETKINGNTGNALRRNDLVDGEEYGKWTITDKGREALADAVEGAQR